MESQKVQIKEKIKLLEDGIRKSKELNQGFSKSSVDELFNFYDLLIQLDNKDYYTYLEKALAQIHILNDHKSANNTLDTAAEFFIYDKVLFLRVIYVYKELRKFDKAIYYLDKVIKKEIANDYFYGDRAELNRKLGNFKEAEEDQKIYDEYLAREREKWDDPDHYYHYK